MTVNSFLQRFPGISSRSYFLKITELEIMSHQPTVNKYTA